MHRWFNRFLFACSFSVMLMNCSLLISADDCDRPTGKFLMTSQIVCDFHNLDFSNLTVLFFIYNLILQCSGVWHIGLLLRLIWWNLNANGNIEISVYKQSCTLWDHWYEWGKVLSCTVKTLREKLKLSVCSMVDKGMFICTKLNPSLQLSCWPVKSPGLKAMINALKAGLSFLRHPNCVWGVSPVSVLSK